MIIQAELRAKTASVPRVILELMDGVTSEDELRGDLVNRHRDQAPRPGVGSRIGRPMTRVLVAPRGRSHVSGPIGNAE